TVSAALPLLPVTLMAVTLLTSPHGVLFTRMKFPNRSMVAESPGASVTVSVPPLGVQETDARAAGAAALTATAERHAAARVKVRRSRVMVSILRGPSDSGTPQGSDSRAATTVGGRRHDQPRPGVPACGGRFRRQP